MKVILVMVQTINGKTTKGNDPDIYKWTSKEDANFFFSLLKKHTLIVMGSGTYDAARKKIKPVKGQLRIILTRNPKKYKSEEVPGQLEFRNVSPKKLLGELQNKFKAMLLVGGGEVNKAFLQARLIDEIYVTIEPKIFGEGKPLTGEGSYESSLKFLSSEQLNKQGTLLLHYTVERNKADVD